jgi:hypothetical protein
MIEAVNSVISNAGLARGVAVQAATLNSFAADQEAVETVARAPVAPFISPYISVDTNFDTAVLQIRDSDTGDVLKQFPSESTLQQRRAQAARQESQSLQAQSRETREASSQPVRLPDAPSTTFQAQQVAQQSATPPVAAGGEAQAAIAALSAGAQSGQAESGSVNVTA